jgi:hypothetical protein
MLADSQKQVLQQIADQRKKEGPSCYFETRAIFNRLMEGALFADRNLTREKFLQLAHAELETLANK